MRVIKWAEYVRKLKQENYANERESARPSRTLHRIALSRDGLPLFSAHIYRQYVTMMRLNMHINICAMPMQETRARTHSNSI